MRRTLSAVIIMLALTACSSSATGGHGAMDGGGAGSGSAGGRGSSSASASGSDPVSATSVPSVSAPATSSGPAPGPALSCAPGSVTTTGAPFCYPLPRGFTDVSSQVNYGQGWTYRTLVSVGGHDLIEVLGSIYPSDTDTLDAAHLRALYDGAGLLVRGRLGFTSVSSVRTTTVDGARAFVQDGTYTSGVRSHDVRLYTGRTIVFISCQSLQRTADVQGACDEVVSGIHVVRT